MRMHGRTVRWWRVALVTVTAVLGTAGSAAAFQGLPPGGQVNDDLAAGINKAIGVNGDEPTNADVVGGALTAGKPAVPWAVFRQDQADGSSPLASQIFARSFASGAWTTRGNGTVGGRSSASPTFSGSLNFDQGRTARRRRSTSPEPGERCRGRRGTRTRRVPGSLRTTCSRAALTTPATRTRASGSSAARAAVTAAAARTFHR